MPTYEYACRACGEHVEVVQSFRDDPLTECTLCGGQLRKVFSAAGIIFKGDGYYVTDTRKRDKAATGSSKEGKGGKDGKEGKADKESSSDTGTSESGGGSESKSKSSSSGSGPLAESA